MSREPVKPGDVVADKYVIERTIGEGGMGTVYAARHRQLDQLVAIKFLMADTGSGVASQRFLREARAAARIRSEHVCRVLDIGELDEVPYMVMEHLEGRDLSQELAARSRLPSGEAVDYLLDACQGLSEAHAAGIVHRDLKPGNLFLVTRTDGTRVVKVLDFGVSKMLDPDSGNGLALTATATLVGSPLYMSPEQLESSKNVDARTDIWALGVVLYELLVGEPPFLADSVPQLVNAVLNGEVASFEEAGVSVPAGLDAIVLRALKRDRDERYSEVCELAAALAPFGGRRVQSTVVGAALSAAGAAPASRANAAVTVTATEGEGHSVRASEHGATPVHWERPSGGDPVPGARRAWFWPVALAVVVLIGVTFWWATREELVAAPVVDRAPRPAAAVPLPAKTGDRAPPRESPPIGVASPVAAEGIAGVPAAGVIAAPGEAVEAVVEAPVDGVDGVGVPAGQVVPATDDPPEAQAAAPAAAPEPPASGASVAPGLPATQEAERKASERRRRLRAKAPRRSVSREPRPRPKAPGESDATRDTNQPGPRLPNFGGRR